jgi:3'-phosphoadenosine 5'-phosphosulfate (PAPS) 3'-phosphatase
MSGEGGEGKKQKRKIKVQGWKCGEETWGNKKKRDQKRKKEGKAWDEKKTVVIGFSHLNSATREFIGQTPSLETNCISDGNRGLNSLTSAASC